MWNPGRQPRAFRVCCHSLWQVRSGVSTGVSPSNLSHSCSNLPQSSKVRRAPNGYTSQTPRQRKENQGGPTSKWQGDRHLDPSQGQSLQILFPQPWRLLPFAWGWVVDSPICRASLPKCVTQPLRLKTLSPFLTLCIFLAEHLSSRSIVPYHIHQSSPDAQSSLFSHHLLIIVFCSFCSSTKALTFLSFGGGSVFIRRK